MENVQSIYEMPEQKKKLLKSGQYEDWPVKLTASVTLDILKIVRVFSKMPDFNSGQY